MRQSVVEEDEGEHAVGDWGLESGFGCEDGVAVDWIIVAYCFCEFADLCHGDFPRNAFGNHTLFHDMSAILNLPANKTPPTTDKSTNT